jgi:glycosyltransferase involved in cell wall biosynthesis
MDIKICVVASYFYPRGYGGNSVFELCMQLVRRGVEVHVITSHIEGLPKCECLQGVYVDRIPTYFLRLFNTEYPLSPTAITDIWKSAIQGSDIIHANFEIFQTTLSASIVKTIKKEPMVLSMHGQGRNKSASYGSSMLNIGYTINHNSLERIAVRSADRIIALTRAVQAKALKLGADPHKLSIIPNGVNTDYFKPFSLSQAYFNKLNLAKENEIAVFVGRLHPTHGIELLLDAIPRILKFHPNLIWILAGDGPLKNDVLDFVRSNGLEKNVRVLGYRNDIKELLNMANIVVYPALSVGMPLTVLEAMACGKAVVAFNIDGNRELIIHGKTGFLVDLPTTDKLVSTCLAALSDHYSLKIMGQNARKSVETNFTWSNTAEKVIHVYQDLLQQC